VSKAATGLSVSVQTRLNQHARAIGADPNFVLARYAAERFLYRLSRSECAERLVLKGAMLMLAWLGESIRPTRDIDFLGYGDLEPEALRALLIAVCTTPVEPDGLEFHTDTLRIDAIRAEDDYGGWRATLRATLGNARIPLQIDVGLGDATVPEPEWIDYPGILDFPRAHIRAYCPETSIAEKVHAMVQLGEANSRMRDFFDIYALATHQRFELRDLATSLRATFEQRKTPLPPWPPLALTEAFWNSMSKQQQWHGFVQRSALAGAPVQLRNVVAPIAQFLEPALRAACRSDDPEPLRWPPGGPWRQA